MTISLYDAVMLAIVLFAAVQGAWRGMAWQLAPIASLVLGYMFAVPLSASTAPWFGEPPLNRVFAMITMYILVSLGVYLIARSLRESIERTKMVEFDRHLGALLGLVKGVLFTVVLTIGLVCVSPTAAGLIVHSETRTVAEYIINIVEPLLPSDLHQVIDPYLKPIEDLPDDEPRPYDSRKSSTPDETTRSRTRRHEIFEEELLDSEEMTDPLEESPKSPTRRRRSTGQDEYDPLTERRHDSDSADDRTSADGADDDLFLGADPNRLSEEPTKPRRR